MSDEQEPFIYSGGWWMSRTPKQLHVLKRDSFPGGKAYDGAVAELERRSGAKREKKDRAIALWAMWAAIVAAVASIAAIFN